MIQSGSIILDSLIEDPRSVQDLRVSKDVVRTVEFLQKELYFYYGTFDEYKKKILWSIPEES